MSVKEAYFVQVGGDNGTQYVPVPLEEGLRSLPFQPNNVYLVVEYKDGKRQQFFPRNHHFIG